MILPLLSRTMELWRWLGREMCFICMSHSTVVKFQKAEDGPKECVAKEKTDTAHHSCPTPLRYQLAWGGYCRGNSLTCWPQGDPELLHGRSLRLGKHLSEGRRRPLLPLARGCALQGQKHKVHAFKVLGADVSLTSPHSNGNSTTHPPYAAVIHSKIPQKHFYNGKNKFWGSSQFVT